MLYLLMADGTCKELSNANTAVVRDEELVCLDRAGKVTARYDRLAVTAFGHDPVLRECALEDGQPVMRL